MLKPAPPWVQAIVRGAIGGVIAGGLAAFASLSSGHSVRDAGIAAGLAFFSYLAVRGGIEGALDQTTSGPTSVAR